MVWLAAARTGNGGDVTSDRLSASAGFTSTSPAFKRRDRRCRAGCASSANEKGEVGMGGGSVVCVFQLGR